MNAEITDTSEVPHLMTREKLLQDLRTVVADAEELFRATATQAGERVAAAREQFRDSLDRAKVKLAVAEDALLLKSKQAARATDEYVQENPWRAVGIGAGVGLVVGLLIARR